MAELSDGDPYGYKLARPREPVDEAALDEAREDGRELPLLDRGARLPLRPEDVFRCAAKVEDLAEQGADGEDPFGRPLLQRRVGDDSIGLGERGLERAGRTSRLGGADEERDDHDRGEEGAEEHAPERCIACATGGGSSTSPKPAIEGIEGSYFGARLPPSPSRMDDYRQSVSRLSAEDRGGPAAHRRAC